MNIPHISFFCQLLVFFFFIFFDKKCVIFFTVLFFRQNPAWRHNYSGNNDYLQPGENYVTEVNYYLNLAETYNKGLVNNFETSLVNRPAAKNYFSNCTNELKANSYYIDEIKPGGYNFDFLINVNNDATTYIFADIIKNLPTVDERYAFRECYRILANEAYKEGLGTSRNGSNSYMTKYQKEKDSIKLYINISQSYGYPSFQNIDLEQEYGANNFVNITNLLDSLIDTATPTWTKVQV